MMPILVGYTDILCQTFRFFLERKIANSFSLWRLCNLNTGVKGCIDEEVFMIFLAIFRALRSTRDDIKNKKNSFRLKNDEFVGEFVVEIEEDFAVYKFINIVEISR